MEEWVPAEDEEDVLDDLDPSTAMMPKETSQLSPHPEEQGDQEEEDDDDDGVVVGEGEEMGALTNGVAAVTLEGDGEGVGEKPAPPPPDYEELLPPAPVNGEGSSAGATVEEGDGGVAVGNVKDGGVSTPDGSDAHLEEKAAAASAAAPVSA